MFMCKWGMPSSMLNRPARKVNGAPFVRAVNERDDTHGLSAPGTPQRRTLVDPGAFGASTPQ